MKCSKCGYLLDQKAELCINCGMKIRHTAKKAYKGNIIGNSNNVILGDINEIKINNYKRIEEELIHYRRLNPKYSFFLSSGVKVGIVLLSLSIFINFASVASTLGFHITYFKLPNLFSLLLWIVTIISIILLFTMLQLKVDKEVKLPLFKGDFLNLFMDDKECISISSHIVSECPFCPSGHIVVQRFLENNKAIYAGQCTKNGQHLYTFDDETYTGTRIRI